MAGFRRSAPCPVLKPRPALADAWNVAVLSLDDVASSPGRARVPEWSPATCKAVLGLCEQALSTWTEQFPVATATGFLERSRALPGAAAAQRRQWQDLAVEICTQAVALDPDWFCRYWRSAVRSGVRPPGAVTRLLVGLDFLRPSGSRLRALAS